MNFTAKPGGMRNAASTLLQQGSEINQIKLLVGNVKMACNTAGIRNSNVNYNLRNIMNRLENQSDDLKDMGRGLEDISKLYIECERTILGELSSDEAVPDDENGTERIHGGGSRSFEEQTKWEWTSIFDLIGELGFVGSGIAGIGKVFDGVSWETVFSMGGALTKMVGEGVKLADKANVSWMDLLGMGEDLSELNLTSGLKAFGSSFKKDTFDDFWKLGKGSKAVGVAGVVTKWLGAGFSFAENSAKYYEQDSSNKGKVFTRAALETAIDIGVDAGIKAGVTGIAAGIFGGAAIATGAPAIAVGAAAVGVSWLLNTGVKHATGKDIGEWGVIGVEKLADATVSGAQWVGEQAKKVGDKAVSVIKSTHENVTNGIRNIGTRWNKFVAAF